MAYRLTTAGELLAHGENSPTNTRPLTPPSQPAPGGPTQWGVWCPVNNAKTDVELATSYGRNSRKVFDGETWDEALDRIKAAWEMIPVDLDWAIALPRIRAAWDMGPPDPLA